MHRGSSPHPTGHHPEIPSIQRPLRDVLVGDKGYLHKAGNFDVLMPSCMILVLTPVSWHQSAPVSHQSVGFSKECISWESIIQECKGQSCSNLRNQMYLRTYISVWLLCLWAVTCWLNLIAMGWFSITRTPKGGWQLPETPENQNRPLVQLQLFSNLSSLS